MSNFPFLTILTLLPLAGGLLLLALKPARPQAALQLALTFSLVTLVLSGCLWANFDSNLTALQFPEKHPWIQTLGDRPTAAGQSNPAVEYSVGIDGLGLLMVLLTALLVPMSILVSRRVAEKTYLYFALVLFLQAGLFGTFTALNFFHWFLFWELSLIPAFFLIKLWGGPDRASAATQFFIYTMVGSIAMLLGFLALFLGAGTFDFIRLAELAHQNQLTALVSGKLSWLSLRPDHLMLVIFTAVFLGFAVKVPIIPLHTWLPSTYAEAPTGTTMLLTGLMSKMGVYGLVRILLPIFPTQMQAVWNWLLLLAVATIVFSAFAAMAQPDLKRLLAYSSINHLGYCLLGIFALARLSTPIAANPNLALEKTAALNGVLLQMFNHGLTAAALFAFVAFIEERTGGLRGLNDFGGLRKVAPVFCGLMGIALFASLGLPGLNGFIGEFLIFKGAFALATWATALSTLGLLATAVFLLTLLQRVFNGPLNAKWTGFADLTIAERAVIVPAIILMFIIGIYPQFIVRFINKTVVQMVAQLPL